MFLCANWGGGGAMVDHDAGLEIDRFDAFADHMLVKDNATGEVVGVYRLMRSDQAERGRPILY